MANKQQWSKQWQEQMATENQRQREEAESYNDLMKRVQENADVAMVHAGLRTISIKAEPVADEPPALPAPKESE